MLFFFLVIISVCQTISTHAMNSTYLQVTVTPPEMSSAQVQPMGPSGGFLGPAGPEGDVAPILPTESNQNYLVKVEFVNVLMTPLPELQSFLLSLDGSAASVTFKGFVNGEEIILVKYYFLTLYLIETPLNAFANRADPDQAVLIRAA